MRPAITGLLTFAVITFSLAVTPAAAQSAGVKGGLTISKLDTQPDSGDVLGTRQDWSAGVFLIPRKNSNATVQLEGLYSRRGTGLDADVFGFGIGDIRLTYLDVSALLRLRAGSGDTGFYVLAGPTVGFKLDAELVAFGLSPSIEPVFKDTETALTFGAGIESGRFMIEGRYHLGITNVIQGVDFAGLGAKNRSASVMVGVKF
jgi:hypothetical protein